MARLRPFPFLGWYTNAVADEALLRSQKIQAIKRPSLRSQRNVHNLIHNTESLVYNEADWIREGTDLAALGRAADRGWLNTFLENILNTISRAGTRVSTHYYLYHINARLPLQYGSVTFLSPLIICGPRTGLACFPPSTIVWCAFSDTFQQTLFRTHEQKIKTGDEALHLVSLDRLDNVLRAIVTILATFLLLAPVFVLFKLQPTNRSEVELKSNYQILTIFIFTLLFSASCSIFTQAKKQEVFTATAAYSAVLVVFLGNTSNVLVATDN